MQGRLRLFTENYGLWPTYSWTQPQTEHEKANAKRLKERLEGHLGQDVTPEGAWTGIMFRFGRGVKEIKSLPAPKGDWTDHPFRLGRMLRRGFKR
jgi:hypothetical protein